MKKIITLSILSVAIIFLAGCGQQKEIETSQKTPAPQPTAVETPVANETMVTCGEKDDPFCFLNRMKGCLPVTTKMTGSDNKTAIEIIILGVENEKCHLQRKINNALDFECYFPKGTLNEDTLGQMFGTDKGLQKVVDEACSKPGW